MKIDEDFQVPFRHECHITRISCLERYGEQGLDPSWMVHGDYPCHCVAENVWYSEKINTCLIWDVEEIHAIGLPDH